MLKRAACLLALVVLIALSASAKKKDAAGASTAVDPAQYVGSEQCMACHEGVAKSFEAGPHWKTIKKDSHGAQGCEACHGPGKAHIEATDPSKIIQFETLKPDQASRQCLQCHQFSNERGNFSRSAHMTNKVGCTDCHSIHKAKVEKALLKDTGTQLCYSCHANVKPSFAMPFHHRVNEGLLGCNDCHNPHGGQRRHQLQTSVSQDEVCFKCHTDKQGPFAFEHAPMRTSGCVACHTPHGSSNPRMLTRTSVNLLCLECHTFTVNSGAPAIPSFHNQAQKYQACTLCHSAMHGSNSDKMFFKQ